MIEGTIVKQTAQYEIIKFTPQFGAKYTGYDCVMDYVYDYYGVIELPRYIYIARLSINKEETSAVVGFENCSRMFSYYGVGNDTENCTEEDMYAALVELGLGIEYK